MHNKLGGQPPTPKGGPNKERSYFVGDRKAGGNTGFSVMAEGDEEEYGRRRTGDELEDSQDTMKRRCQRSKGRRMYCSGACTKRPDS